MLFQRINRSSPEKVFVVVKNGYSTAAITNGQVVNWDFITAKDGVTVTMPLARATNAGFATAGIVASTTIASADFGLVQVYGFHSAARTREKTSAPTIALGQPLIANIAGSVFCLENMSTASTTLLVFPCAISLHTNASFTTKAAAVFIKAM